MTSDISRPANGMVLQHLHTKKIAVSWHPATRPPKRLAHPQGLKLLSAARLDLAAEGLLGVQHLGQPLLLGHVLLPLRPVADRKLVLVSLMCDLAQVHL